MEQGDGAGKEGQAAAWLERRREREGKWRERLAEWRSSGLSQAAFCRQQGLAAAQLSWWKYDLARRDGTLGAADVKTKKRRPKEEHGPAFIPLRVAAAAPSPAIVFEVLLHGGNTVRVPTNFNEHDLRRLFAVLREDSRAC